MLHVGPITEQNMNEQACFETFEKSVLYVIAKFQILPSHPLISYDISEGELFIKLMSSNLLNFKSLLLSSKN